MSVDYRGVLPLQAKLTKTVKLRMTPQLWMIMRAHAFERQVSFNRLNVDVIQCWAVTVTDPENPVFAPEHMGVRLPDLPEERYPGYLASLGYDPSGLDDAVAPLGGDATWKDNHQEEEW